MYSALLLSVLAAGVLGAPLDPRELVVNAVTTTIWITLRPGESAPSPVPNSNKFRERWHPRHTTTVVAPVPSPSPSPAPVNSPSPSPVAPAPTTTSSVASASATPTSPSSSGADGSPVESGVSWLQVANKWRAKKNLPLFTWNTVITAQAVTAGQEDNGDISNGHKGDFGVGGESQVMAGGANGPRGADAQGLTNFELAYVSWLCEVPSDPALKSDGKDYCAIIKQVVNMQYQPGETGHYDILNDASNLQIGCSFVANPNGKVYNGDTPGLWTCNLVGKGSKYYQS